MVLHLGIMSHSLSPERRTLKDCDVNEVFQQQCHFKRGAYTKIG